MSSVRYRWHIHDERIREMRYRLICELGGCCSVCRSDEIEELEFHHVYGKDWRSRDLGPYRRMLQYQKDAADGSLVLLCGECHDYADDHPDWCFCPKCRQGSDF